MLKILTLNNISSVGLDRFPRDSYEIASEFSAPDAILLRSYKMHDMDVPDSVQAIGRAGAGTNNIPIAKMSDQGICVFNAPGANANAVKELVLAGMLISCRNIAQAWDFTRNLEGSDAELMKQAEGGKKNYVGSELPGRTLGVVGLGAIGVLVANMAKSLGMKVIGYDPTMTVERAWQISSDVEQASSVDDLLQRVDFVTFHVPLTEQTKHIINEERLKTMKDGVVILNFARDGIVDDKAVCAVLDTNKIGGYVCDFPTNCLKQHPKVVTLPHLGASTTEAEVNCAVMVADQVSDYLENGNVLNSVNFPTVNLPRKGDQRIAVVNANVPDMVSQISQKLGEANLNIQHMVNESRGEIAYTLVDIAGEVADATRDAIAAINGVLNVRVI